MAHPKVAIPTPAAFIATTTILWLLGFILFLVRMQTRYTQRRLALDDLFLAVAAASCSGLYIAGVLATCYGLGRHQSLLSSAQLHKFASAEMASFWTYAWTVAFVKISLAWQLMRINGHEAVWRIGLFVLMAAVSIVLIASNIILILETLKVMEFSVPWGLFYTVFNIVSDVTFTVVPMFFIVGMKRTLRERILLMFLFALGLLCTCAAIPRLFAQQSVLATDFTYFASPILFWSELEALIGLIAATLPSLRNVFFAHLRKRGLLQDEPDTFQPPTFCPRLNSDSELQSIPTRESRPGEKLSYKSEEKKTLELLSARPG